MRLITRTLTLFLAIAMACLSYHAYGQSASTVKRNKRIDGVLTFDLGPHGMDPSAVTVSEGWYIVRVRNGMSTKAITVVVAVEPSTSRSAQGSSIPQAASEAKKQGSEQFVHLQQGTYSVTATGATQWKAAIEVTANENEGK